MDEKLVKEAALRKVAAINFGTIAEKALIGGALTAGAITVATAADAIMNYFADKHEETKTKEYFEKMLEMHPQLQKFDPNDVAKYWESLNHFAPAVAEDPLAAGAFITQSLSKLSDSEFGGPPPDTFSTLTNIGKAHADMNQKIKGDKLSNIARKSSVDNVVGNVFKFGLQ